MFEVLVKFDGQCLSLAVDAAWTVDNLKSEIVRCHRDAGLTWLKPADIEIIFCGKKLSDGLKLEVG